MNEKELAGARGQTGRWRGCTHAEGRSKPRGWRVDHFGSVGGGSARLIDATAAPSRPDAGGFERVKACRGVTFTDNRTVPYTEPSLLLRRPSTLWFPPSRTAARVLTEQRAFGFAVGLQASPSSLSLLYHHPRRPSDRGCFDATRRNATRCALSLFLSLYVVRVSFLARSLSFSIPTPSLPSRAQFSPEDRAVYR